ncbi:hypothetical protein [Azotobacter salinestris]|uniref:hypothetical protein n=1 Tax=Azotobacter salinestris TaxID=69964 RepID=UPI0032DE8C87
MDMNLARLRKLAAEHGDAGSPDARDALILTFLQELNLVLAKPVIDIMSDVEIRQCYVKWTKAILLEATMEDRHEWLVRGVRLVLSDYTEHPVEPAEKKLPTNVVSLTK